MTVIVDSLQYGLQLSKGVLKLRFGKFSSKKNPRAKTRRVAGRTVSLSREAPPSRLLRREAAQLAMLSGWVRGEWAVDGGGCDFRCRDIVEKIVSG